MKRGTGLGMKQSGANIWALNLSQKVMHMKTRGVKTGHALF